MIKHTFITTVTLPFFWNIFAGMKRFGTSLVLVVAAFSTAACFDAEGRFEEYGDRLVDAGPPVELPDAAPLAEIPDVSGSFLVGLATTVAPDLPLRFRFINEMVVDTAGATLTTRVQPLAVATGMPVGNEIVVEGIAVNVAGEFEIVLDPVAVAGQANPISGSDIEASIVLAGRIRSEERFCGTVPMGSVTKPLVLDVTGSTWSAIRIGDGVIGGDLPPVELVCPPDDSQGPTAPTEEEVR